MLTVISRHVVVSHWTKRGIVGIHLLGGSTRSSVGKGHGVKLHVVAIPSDFYFDRKPTIIHLVCHSTVLR